MLSMDFETDVKNDEFDQIDTMWTRNLAPIDNDVAVIILKINYNTNELGTKSFDTKILGKTCTEWVSLAFDKCPILEIETTDKADILATIRPHLTEKKYTAVFYADTPLLGRKIFLSCLDYAQSKGMNVCKFERAYIFKTDYIRTAEKIYSTALPNFAGLIDFLSVKDAKSLTEAQTELKKRILDFHINNGVQILDTTWTSIDADVEIGAGTIIYPQNVLVGNTIIGQNVVLQVGNTIINSAIGDNSKLIHCVVEESKITPNSDLAPFTYVFKGVVKKEK